MNMPDGILRLLFPGKCVLCRKILPRHQTDLCHRCRVEVDQVPPAKIRIPYLAGWTAVWYYEGSARQSLLRFKFRGARSYAGAYGRMLAMKLSRELPESFDLLTWVPVSRRRRFRRGYDQVALLASSVGRELGMEPVPLLRKRRDNPPQSGIHGLAARRANVLGVFAVTDPAMVLGKRILLLDDVITTGATAGECARTLLTAGAKEVYCAAVATARHHSKNR